MADEETAPEVRKGQGDVKLSREEFRRRLGERFYDPAFDVVRAELERVIDVAWEGYDRYRKSPASGRRVPTSRTPEQELPVERLETRERIQAAERRQRDPRSPRRVLVVAGAARHDQTCPGEMSKTPRPK